MPAEIHDPLGGRDPEVVACLQPDTSVRQDLMSWGQVTASSMFQQIGVRLRWSCDTALMASTSRGKRVVLVRVVAEIPRNVEGKALAVALPFASEGVRVVVYWERLQVLAAAYPSSAGKILGHVLAHELGHVFSRVDAHSRSGLMRAEWTNEDFAAMRKGMLWFTAEEGQFIRNALSRGDDTPSRPAISKPVAQAIRASSSESADPAQRPQ